MILILGGTSDTHEYIEKNNSDDYIITVATDYGFNLFNQKYAGRVIKIRFTMDSLKDFICTHNINKVVDITHPFAKIISETSSVVCCEMQIRYERISRDIELPENAPLDLIIYCDTFEEAANAVETNDFKNVLLTTGAKEANKFACVSDRCYIRVLPSEDSISLAKEAGFTNKRIIAMQGPFSTDFNTALLKELKADCLVTKLTGKKGGLDEKLDSCRKLNLKCILIRP